MLPTKSFIFVGSTRTYSVGRQTSSNCTLYFHPSQSARCTIRLKGATSCSRGSKNRIAASSSMIATQPGALEGEAVGLPPCCPSQYFLRICNSWKRNNYLFWVATSQPVFIHKVTPTPRAREEQGRIASDLTPDRERARGTPKVEAPAAVFIVPLETRLHTHSPIAETILSINRAFIYIESHRGDHLRTLSSSRGTFGVARKSKEKQR
jgi:hypothetical protein